MTKLDYHNWAIAQFWDMYQRTIFVRCYYHRYREKKNLLKNIVGVFLIATSLAGFSGLWFWEKIPHIWSVVSLIAQLVSAAAYLFPFSEDIQSLNYLIPELQSLEYVIDRDYSRLSFFTDDEIIKKVYSYRERTLALEQKYTNSAHFPFDDKCKEKADIDKLAFIQERFGTPETQQ